MINSCDLIITWIGFFESFGLGILKPFNGLCLSDCTAVLTFFTSVVVIEPVKDSYLESYGSVPGYEDVPIIALTANVMEGVKEMFIREGMNDFIAKPVYVRELVGAIKKWLLI